MVYTTKMDRLTVPKARSLKSALSPPHLMHLISKLIRHPKTTGQCTQNLYAAPLFISILCLAQRPSGMPIHCWSLLHSVILQRNPSGVMENCLQLLLTIHWPLTVNRNQLQVKPHKLHIDLQWLKLLQNVYFNPVVRLAGLWYTWKQFWAVWNKLCVLLSIINAESCSG